MCGGVGWGGGGLTPPGEMAPGPVGRYEGITPVLIDPACTGLSFLMNSSDKLCVCVWVDFIRMYYYVCVTLTKSACVCVCVHLR